MPYRARNKRFQATVLALRARPVPEPQRWASRSIKARNSKGIVRVVSGKEELDNPSPSTNAKLKGTMPGRRPGPKSVPARAAEYERPFARAAVDLQRFGVHRFAPFQGKVPADLRRPGPRRCSRGRGSASPF